MLQSVSFYGNNSSCSRVKSLVLLFKFKTHSYVKGISREDLFENVDKRRCIALKPLEGGQKKYEDEYVSSTA